MAKKITDFPNTYREFVQYFPDNHIIGKDSNVHYCLPLKKYLYAMSDTNKLEHSKENRV